MKYQTNPSHCFSTIFKQMKVIYGDQYSEDERRQFLQAVYINILQAIQTLCAQTVVFQLENQIQCPDEFNYLRGLEPKEINIKTGTCTYYSQYISFMLRNTSKRSALMMWSIN